MQFTARATIEVTAECGHKFTVSVIGLDTDTDLVCPTCGFVDHFDADQIASIREKFDAAVAKAAAEEVRKSTDDILASSTRGLKNVKYTPKR